MRNAKGFSMIEALLSIAIVAVAAIGILSLHSQLVKNQTIVAQRQEAMFLLQKKMEQLRNINSVAEYDAISSGSDVVSGVTATYSRSWQVSSFSSPDYKSVAVSVSWTTATGENQSVNLTSQIAKQIPTDSATVIASPP